MMRQIFTATFVIAAAVGHVGPATAQPIGQVTLSPAEMQATAVAALRTGQSARALALAEALLLRDINDKTALRIASQAALNIGRSDVASERARALYQVSDTDAGRFIAARLVALAETQKDNFTTAQFWLRRARQNAPDASAARQVASDFRAVRQRNPLQFNLSLGVTPSSNINNGSSEESIDVYFFGQTITLALPPSAQSLSGYERAASAVLGYTLSDTENGRTQVYISAQTVRYTLSDEAKELAPTFDAGTLDYDRVVLGLRQDLRVGPSGQPITARLDYGMTQLGGAPYATDIGVGVSSYWSVSDASQITAGLRFGQINYDKSGFESNSRALDLGWNHRLSNGDGIYVAGTLERSRSADSVQLTSDRRSIDVTYNFGRIYDHFDVSVAMGRQWRDVGTDDSGRSEIRNDATLTVGFPTLEYYGFAPVAEVEAQQTKSDAVRFQSDGLSLDLSIRSNF